MRSSLLLAAIAPLLVTRAAAAQATLGPEVDPAPIVAGADWNRATAANAAFGSGETLVVWRDERALPDFNTIYAARIDTAGNVLDSVGVPVVRSTDSLGSPAVAFDGANFVVAWMQFSGGTAGCDVRAVRLRPDGARLDLASFVLARDVADTLTALRAVADQVGVLLVWSDYSRVPGPPGFRAIHIARDGSTIEPAPILPITRSTCVGRFDVAFDGANDWIAWDDYPCGPTPGDAHVLVTRVAPSTLAALDASPLAMPGAPAQFGGRIACTTSQCLVTWNPIESYYATGVAAARVRADGVLVDTTPLVVLDNRDRTIREPGPVGVVGNDFFASWTRWPGSVSRVFGESVRANGAIGVSIEAPIAPDNAQAGPFISTPTGPLWIWPGAWDYATPVRATRVATDLASISPPVIDIQTNANPTQSAALGSIGADMLLAWIDARGGVAAAPVDTAGHARASALLTGSQLATGTPSVSHAGATFVVAWREDPGRVQFSRIARDGSLVDHDARLVVDEGYQPARMEGPVTSSAAGYAWITWSEYLRGGATGTNTISLFRVAFDGTVTPLTLPPHESLGEVRGPTLASNGVFTLLAWVDWQGLHAVRYNETDGSLRDAEPIALASMFQPESPPVAASDGGGFIVVWRANETGVSYLESMRVAFDGLPLDHLPTRIATVDATASVPVVAFDGAAYRILWTENPTGTTPVLYDASIAPDGRVSMPIATVLDGATTPVHGLAWELAPSGNGVLAYQRFDESDPFGSVRVRTRGWSDPGVTPRDAGVVDWPDAFVGADVLAPSDGATSDGFAPSDAAISDVFDATTTVDASLPLDVGPETDASGPSGARAGCSGCGVPHRGAHRAAWFAVLLVAVARRRRSR